MRLNSVCAHSANSGVATPKVLERRIRKAWGELRAVTRIKVLQFVSQVRTASVLRCVLLGSPEARLRAPGPERAVKLGWCVARSPHTSAGRASPRKRAHPDGMAHARWKPGRACAAGEWCGRSNPVPPPATTQPTTQGTPCGPSCWTTGCRSSERSI